jgi:DNA-binding transcriptional regulator GbsR (MarR family)
MSSPAITTVIKMMESLPEDLQERVVEHLQEYLADLQDELKWNNSFKKTQSKLIALAQKAKQEIAEGLAKPMDYDHL